MGRPKKIADATPVEPTPAPAPQVATTISKAEAVRRALAEGLSTPGEIADYAMTRYRLDIPKPQVSAYKAQGKAKAAASNSKPNRKPKAAVEGYLAQPPKIEAKGDGDLLDALKAMKPLIAQYGPAKVKEMVDLLG